jgi:hypothetical protein
MVYKLNGSSVKRCFSATRRSLSFIEESEPGCNNEGNSSMLIIMADIIIHASGKVDRSHRSG